MEVSLRRLSGSPGQAERLSAAVPRFAKFCHAPIDDLTLAGGWLVDWKHIVPGAPVSYELIVIPKYTLEAIVAFTRDARSGRESANTGRSSGSKSFSSRSIPLIGITAGKGDIFFRIPGLNFNTNHGKTEDQRTTCQKPKGDRALIITIRFVSRRWRNVGLHTRIGSVTGFASGGRWLEFDCPDNGVYMFRARSERVSNGVIIIGKNIETVRYNGR